MKTLSTDVGTFQMGFTSEFTEPDLSPLLEDARDRIWEGRFLITDHLGLGSEAADIIDQENGQTVISAIPKHPLSKSMHTILSHVAKYITTHPIEPAEQETISKVQKIISEISALYNPDAYIFSMNCSMFIAGDDKRLLRQEIIRQLTGKSLPKSRCEFLYTTEVMKASIEQPKLF